MSRPRRRHASRALLVLAACACGPGERPPPPSRAGAGETAPAPPSPAAPDTAGALPAEVLSARPTLANLPEVTRAYRELYPPPLLEAGTGGSTVVRVVVDERGTPVEVAVERSSGHPELDDASLLLARLMRFHPGECRGVAVRAHFPLPVTWSPRVESSREDSAARLPSGRGAGFGAPREGPCARQVE